MENDQKIKYTKIRNKIHKNEENGKNKNDNGSERKK